MGFIKDENGEYIVRDLGTKKITENGVYKAKIEVDVKKIRELPEDWAYYIDLKTRPEEHAYLFYSGSETSSCSFTSASGYSHIIYGGSDGKQPLYKFTYNYGWYKWDGTTWVLNTTQPAVKTEMDLRYCDLDTRDVTYWSHLVGKCINDQKLGSTQLFTVVISKGSSTISVLLKTGGNNMVAASIKTSFKNSTNYNTVLTQKLEFVDFSGTGFGTTYMFANCTSLRKITLPEAFDSISNYMFYGCTNLSEIEVLGQIKSIGQYAFSGCQSLKSVPLENLTSSLGSYTFRNWSGVNTITFDETTISPSTEFFTACTNLRRVNLPKNLVVIGQGMFWSCNSLKSLVIPEGVGHTQGHAFNECYSLVKLTLPTTFNSLVAGAFSDCYSLKVLKFKSENAPTMPSAGVFRYPNKYLKILAPYDSLTSYQTSAYWPTTRVRGFGEFSEGDVLPTKTTDERYNLTWYNNLNAMVNTLATDVPTVTPVTVADRDGEFWCTFVLA